MLSFACRPEKPTGRNPLILQGVAAGCASLRTGESRAGDGARTHDSHVGNAEIAGAEAKPVNDLRQTDPALTHPLHTAAPTDPDLARVVEAWSDLPEPIRRAVLALIGSAVPGS